MSSSQRHEFIGCVHDNPHGDLGFIGEFFHTIWCNEKRVPGCLGFTGDQKLISYDGDYFINHEIRIQLLYAGIIS